MMPPICTPRRADDAAPVGDRPAAAPYIAI
jgi:hypothetical protein